MRGMWDDSHASLSAIIPINCHKTRSFRHDLVCIFLKILHGIIAIHMAHNFQKKLACIKLVLRCNGASSKKYGSICDIWQKSNLPPTELQSGQGLGFLHVLLNITQTIRATNTVQWPFLKIWPLWIQSWKFQLTSNMKNDLEILQNDTKRPQIHYLTKISKVDNLWTEMADMWYLA